MQPIRRDLKFKLPTEKIDSWNPVRNTTHFMNTLSLLFPVGERFFIDAVRHYRDKGVIGDEQLLEEIRAFIGQEAMHGREHEDYNAAYAAAGYAVKGPEQFVHQVLETAKRLPPSLRLGATIALEHYTAILANALLENPQIIEGADPRFAAIWNWHALEETEHKAVAYDVFVKAFEGKPLRGYAVRVSSMLMATVILWSIFTPVYLLNVAKSDRALDRRDWLAGLRNLFGRHGVLSTSFRAYLDYFRPGFHPWDHDNRHQLSRIEELAAQYAA